MPVLSGLISVTSLLREYSFVFVKNMKIYFLLRTSVLWSCLSELTGLDHKSLNA